MQQLRPLAAAVASAPAVAAWSLRRPQWREQREEQAPAAPASASRRWQPLPAPHAAAGPVSCQERGRALAAAAGAAARHPTSFDELQDVDDRLRLLQEKSVPFLCGFWATDAASFTVNPLVKHKSMASTAWGLMAILENLKAWKGYVAKDPGSSALVSLPDACAAMLDEWERSPEKHSGDRRAILTIALVKAGVLGLDEQQPLAQRLLEEFVRERAMRRLGTHQPVSAYVRYWSTKATLELSREYGRRWGLPEKLGKDVSMSVHRALEVSYIAMCQQLSYYYSGDRSNFDVIELAYTLLTYYMIERSNVSLASTGDEEAAWPMNMKLVETALTVVFSEQHPDGLWGKGRPISVDTRHHVGNGYVFTFDLLASLVEEFSDVPALLEQFMPNITRSVNWAEESVASFVSSEAGEAGALVRGWRSNHLDSSDSYKGPYAWSTAQVSLCMGRIREFIQHLTDRTVLREFGGSLIQESNRKPWELLLDCDLTLHGHPTSLKKELDARLLSPMEGLEEGKNARPLYSAILFGPPGTAKTTICKSLAYRLGWNFLTIDTGDFLKDGLNGIANRMEYIFRRLKALDRTVILFDEIEEFCLNREDKTLGMESRMLTTAMLTQINDLRREQRCVFFVATNRLTAFDSAIIRPGRFDALLFVGTPNLDARLQRLRSALAAKGVDADSVQGRLAQDFCKEHFDELRFLNFAEGEALALRIAMAACKGGLSRESLSKLLTDATAVATIRGQAREELLAMEGMSRA